MRRWRKRFFAGENPLGKHISVDLSPEDQLREIVAVVKDIPASHPQTRQDAWRSSCRSSRQRCTARDRSTACTSK